MLVRRLDSSWDMTFGHGLACYYRDNDECIGQNIKSRLLLILGEWFLDVSAGMPWQTILGMKPARMIDLEREVRQRVLGTEGVVDITAFNVGFNSATRRATLVITVLTIYATSVTVTV